MGIYSSRLYTNPNDMNELNDLSRLSTEGSELSQPLEHNLDTPLGFENSQSELGEQQSGWSDDVILSPEELDRPIMDDVIPEGLTNDQKAELQERTGWSDDITDFIASLDEAAVYENANLQEVNGNLERTDIEWNAPIPVDRIDRMRTLYGDEVANRWTGKTNMDLIQEGRAPYGPDGELVNLHHIGQHAFSPLAELTYTEHKQFDGILHDKTNASEIDRPVFRSERHQYWQSRYDSLTNN